MAKPDAPRAMRVEQLDRLRPAAVNPRTHSTEQVSQLAAAIIRFGWTVPILYDYGEDETVAGHGRQEAARLIYADGGHIYLAPGKDNGGVRLPHGAVPVMDVTGWSSDERRAYLLADNALAEQAGWDIESLGAELRALDDVGFDLGVIGFTSERLDEMLTPPRPVGADPEEVPETPADPVTRLGDVWVLGRHRIVCGDSTDANVVAKCLNGVEPHLMVTDPPYGVKYDADWRNHTGDFGRSGRAIGKVMNDDRAEWTEAWELFRGDVAYVWHAGGRAHEVAASLISTGLEVRAQIIWNKNMLVISRGDYHQKHEPCWYVVRKGKKGHFDGGRKQVTVWDIDKPQKSETGHSTQKPVECMKRPIENNSKRGQAVYDPFVGSGTTIIAGEMTGRSVHAIELSPAYVDVAVMRWQEFTGQSAILEATGETFAERQAQMTEAVPVEASVGM